MCPRVAVDRVELLPANTDDQVRAKQVRTPTLKKAATIAIAIS
jgi:hypothetical protein